MDGRTDGRSDNTLLPLPILKHSVIQIQLEINDKEIFQKKTKECLIEKYEKMSERP